LFKHRPILQDMKIKIFTILCLSSLILHTSSAQDLKGANADPEIKDTIKTWQKGATVGLNGSQVYLSNWAGGGQNSLSLTSLLSSFANYSKGKIDWKNNLDLGYGIAKLGGGAFKKTDDRIVLLSKFGYKHTKKIHYTALLDFRTQFAPGYRYFTDTAFVKEQRSLISNFMSPAYLITGIGLEYDPIENLYFYLSPLTVRTTFVLDKVLSDAGAFGVSPGRKARYELGYYFTTKYKLKIAENITYSTTLNLFSSYKSPDVMVVLWENILLLKVNKFINASFTTNLFYDQVVKILRKDGTTGAAVQYKQVLAVGLSAKF
jgi:hypothetical protein